MKQIRHLVGLLALLALVIVSCKRDFDLDYREVPPRFPKDRSLSVSSLKELQNLFNLGYEEENHREFQITNTSTESRRIDFLDLEPQWHLAKEFDLDRGQSLLKVVPLKARGAMMRIADGVEQFDLEVLSKYKGKIHRPYLIQTKRGDTSTDGAYFALLIPSVDYIESGKELDRSDEMIPLGFEGLVVLYDLKGMPRYLYNFADGVCKQAYVYRIQDGAQLNGIYIKNCYWVRFEAREPPSPGHPHGIAGAGSKKICEEYYITDNQGSKPNIGDGVQKFQDRINLDGLGEEGGGIPPDQLDSLIKEKERDQKILDTLKLLDTTSREYLNYMMRLSSFEKEAKKIWEKTKSLLTEENRREVGCWIYRHMENDGEPNFIFGNHDIGDPRPNKGPGSGVGAGMNPGKPNTNRDGVPDGAVAIGYIHAHTPTKYLEKDGKQRRSGLSEGDMRWAIDRFKEGKKYFIIAIDYSIGEGHAWEVVPAGLDENSPYFLHMFIPWSFPIVLSYDQLRAEDVI